MNGVDMFLDDYVQQLCIEFQMRRMTYGDAASILAVAAIETCIVIGTWQTAARFILIEPQTPNPVNQKPYTAVPEPFNLNRNPSSI